MSKNQIVTLDNQFIIENKSNENEVISEILRKEFYDWMEINGYNLDKIKNLFDDTKISATEQSQFNILIRKAKQEINISLTEIIMFFEEQFTKFKKILSVFDGETNFELKKELSKKFHIKLDETNLEEILG
jgi:hypothetical protein